MNSLNVNIVDLPDEILLWIFKMINNIELLYSIMGINQRLDKAVSDASLTHSLDLTKISCNDENNSSINEILVRFSTYILPRIRSNVVTLAVQSSMYHHIFRSITYPNLNKVTFDNIQLDMASQIFQSMLFYFALSTFDKSIRICIFSENSSFVRLYKRQISGLVVSFSNSVWKNKDPRIGQIYVGILSWFSNLQYLALDGLVYNPFGRRVLRGLFPNRCFSSLMTHLRVKIYNFDDCLCLIDGRLSQLHTLIVNVDFVHNSTMNISNQVNDRLQPTDNRFICRCLKICVN